MAITTVLISVQGKIKAELETAKESIEAKVKEATQELQIEKEKSEKASALQIEKQIRIINGFVPNAWSYTIIGQN